ncbi:unnamed protein product [Phytomonas sp. EM1]|nr:unnamed protein product [Phytomonas sp. EM1]|eukprot:CCW65618.1 unnamed protein product [Phytomonas sp. isolate EM1]
MSLFKVSCPANLIWHPTVHHSLLLLRALRQPHTLLLSEVASPVINPLSFPLLFQQTMHINISRAREDESQLDGKACCFYQPEHILSFVFSSAEVKEGGEMRDKVRAELPTYLDTAVVASHILNAVDAVLVALSANAMETTRQLHSVVMDLMEQLEATIDDNNAKEEHVGEQDEPLSTWPLYTALQFLIEQGGLLTSAFPRIHQAYEFLNQKNTCIRQHRRFMERTIKEFRINGEKSDLDSLEETYPQRGFLIEVQRRLNDYTTSTSERMSMDVVGDKGALPSRTQGGRLGIQAVPARLPWTMQRTNLTQR